MRLHTADSQRRCHYFQPTDITVPSVISDGGKTRNASISKHYFSQFRILVHIDLLGMKSKPEK
jgi:hypothetical protein